MEKITITEALSEINLIKKKVITKQSKIECALIRAEHLPDPFLTEGGSEEMIKREYQGLRDLNRRLQTIRAKISLANLSNEITVEDETRSIHDWLIWKREISADQIKFTHRVHTAIAGHMKTAGTQPQVFKDAEDKVKLVQYKVNIDYAEWLQRHTVLSEKLEKLDGKLSLKNATIVLEI